MKQRKHLRCQRHGCRESLIGKRRDAAFCSDKCRYLHYDLKNPRQSRATDTGEPQGDSSNGSVRRSSRDGRGVKVYFTPEDLADQSRWWPKLLAARDRLDERKNP